MFRLLNTYSLQKLSMLLMSMFCTSSRDLFLRSTAPSNATSASSLCGGILPIGFFDPLLVFAMFLISKDKTAHPNEGRAVKNYTQIVCRIEISSPLQEQRPLRLELLQQQLLRQPLQQPLQLPWRPWRQLPQLPWQPLQRLFQQPSHQPLKRRSA